MRDGSRRPGWGGSTAATTAAAAKCTDCAACGVSDIERSLYHVICGSIKSGGRKKK